MTDTTTINNMKHIITSVMDLMHTERFDEIDDMYANINHNNSKVDELISYIRTAHQVRNRLQQWYQLVDISYNKAVLEYGEDRADLIFVGLR